MREFNKNVKRLLRKKKLRPKDVAAAAGFSEAVFSNIVNGKRKVYADEVIAIAAALQVPIEALFS